MAQSQLELPDTTQAAVVAAVAAEVAAAAEAQPRGTKRTNHHAVSVAKPFLATSVDI